MAYNAEHLTKLGQLKLLAEKVKAECAARSEFETLSAKVDGLVTAGGEPNKLERIKVNGVEQTVAADKSVDLSVPTKVSQLSNDSKFQSDTQVQSAIENAIADSGHAHFEKVDTVPTAAAAKENVLYLVMNSKTHHYDIYAKVGATVELLDDTTVDLTAYAKTADMNTALSGKVDKDGSKVLSDNNYTTAEKNKLAGLSNYSHPASDAGAKTAELYKIATDAQGHVTAATKVAKADLTALGLPAQDTTYTDATASASGLMSAADKGKLDGMVTATDEEVNAMLAEVFPAA